MLRNIAIAFAQTSIAATLSSNYMKYAGSGINVLRYPSFPSSASAALLGGSVALTEFFLDKVIENREYFTPKNRIFISPEITFLIAFVASKKILQITNKDLGIILLISSVFHLIFKGIFQTPIPKVNQKHK